MAAELYVIEALAPEEAAGADRSRGRARPRVQPLIGAGICLAVAAVAIECLRRLVDGSVLWPVVYVPLVAAAVVVAVWSSRGRWCILSGLALVAVSVSAELLAAAAAAGWILVATGLAALLPVPSERRSRIRRLDG